MRDPIVDSSEIIINTDMPEIIKIDNLPEFDLQDYDLDDEKDFKKYIKAVKQACRGSIEYRKYMKFLRENVDMNKCSFYENVNNLDTFAIKIEIHHDPFSLEDIVRIVYNKRRFNNEDLDVEMVAKETMYLHYKLLVGLIPLAETPHELAENGYLFIPVDKVFGNYKEFVNLYEPYMTESQLYIFDNILEYSRGYNEAENMGVLDLKFVYVDMSGVYSLPPYEVIKTLMETRIQEIKTQYSIDTSNIKIIEPVEPFTFLKKE